MNKIGLGIVGEPIKKTITFLGVLVSFQTDITLILKVMGMHFVSTHHTNKLSLLSTMK